WATRDADDPRRNPRTNTCAGLRYASKTTRETCRSNASHDVEELQFVHRTADHCDDGGALLLQRRPRGQAGAGRHYGADRTLDSDLGCDPIRPSPGVERRMGLAPVLLSI